MAHRFPFVSFNAPRAEHTIFLESVEDKETDDEKHFQVKIIMLLFAGYKFIFIKSHQLIYFNTVNYPIKSLQF